MNVLKLHHIGFVLCENSSLPFCHRCKTGLKFKNQFSVHNEHVENYMTILFAMN